MTRGWLLVGGVEAANDLPPEARKTIGPGTAHWPGVPSASAFRPGDWLVVAPPGQLLPFAAQTYVCVEVPVP